MKHSLTVAALVIAAGFSGAASAQSNQLNGLYFEGKLNVARATINVPGGEVKYRDQALGLGLGYNLDRTFAVEAGYDSFGKDIGLKARGIYAGVVASYQLTPELVGRLKAGVINVQVKDTASGNKDDKNRLYVGAGLEYPIAPQVSLTGDYRYTKVNFDGGISTKIHNFSVGSKYTF